MFKYVTNIQFASYWYYIGFNDPLFRVQSKLSRLIDVAI